MYRRARERGMDFVTITDHDTLEGSLRIAEEPGTFLSSEITVSFPDHDCDIHVVVLGVTEQQFGEALELRDNVYAFVDYLDWEDVAHFVAHPLYVPRGTMTLAVFEKLLLLFNAFEVCNGARPARLNTPVADVVAALTPWHIEELANRHAMEPRGPLPWLKARVGGSDDHTGLFTAGAHTVAPGDGTLGRFLGAIRQRVSAPGGADGDPTYLGHSIYAVARQHALRIASSGPSRGGVLGRPVFRRLFGPTADPRSDVDVEEFAAQCMSAVRRLLPELASPDGAHRIESELGALAHSLWRPSGRREVSQMNERIFALVSDLVREASGIKGRPLVQAVMQRRPGRALRPLAGLAALNALCLPYYVAYHDHSGQRDLVGEIEERFVAGRARRRRKLALFTDTLTDVNGVALTLKRLRRAADAQGTDLVVATCHEGEGIVWDEAERTVSFPVCAELAMPHYEEFVVGAPSLLDVLDYLFDADVAAVHASTPGPMGVTALIAARILRLPIAATFHTDIPSYARILTGRRSAQAAVWAYTLAFYRLVDEVLVPSAHTRRQLIRHGVSPRRIASLPRWVDTDLFCPTRRDLGLWRRYGVGPATKLLYAGRVSREKNMEVLATMFEQLVAAGYGAHLIVAGDGPSRAAMEKRLAGLPVTFLGFLSQDELAGVYASSDLFVFPSATDTFGNVVLEAQSSGLPVVVSDQGGPAELMQHGETGIVVPAGDAGALCAAVAGLLDDPGRLALMSLQARRFIIANQLPLEEQYGPLLRGARCPPARRPGSSDAA